MVADGQQDSDRAAFTAFERVAVQPVIVLYLGGQCSGLITAAAFKPAPHTAFGALASTLNGAVCQILTG